MKDVYGFASKQTHGQTFLIVEWLLQLIIFIFRVGQGVFGKLQAFFILEGFPKSVNDQISKFVLFHLQNRTNNIKFVTSDILSLLCQCQCPVGPDLILSRQPKLSHDNIPGSQPPDKGYNTERIWAWDPHTAPPMRACIGYMGIYIL